MREARPLTQTMTVTDARQHWSRVIAAGFRRQQRVVLEKAGIPVAALVSTADLERLRHYDVERAADFSVFDRSRCTAIARRGSLPTRSKPFSPLPELSYQ